MTPGRVVDAHAHILSEETMALMRKEAPKIGPRLERIDDDFAVLAVGSVEAARGVGWVKRSADPTQSRILIDVVLGHR